MPKSSALSLILLGLTAGFTNSVLADDDDQALELPALIITSQKAATKVSTPVQETPQAVSIIDRSEFEQRGADSVQRATDYTAGVFSNQIGSSNRYDYLVLRGFSDGSLGNTFLDGLKVMGDSNSYSSMVIDPWFLDSIEVVRGPASVLYGRASPGGLVALNSRSPESETSGEVRLGVGNNDQRSAAFDLTGPLNESVNYRLSGMARKADTQFGPVEEERYALSPQLSWQISDRSTLELMAYLHKDPEGGYHSGLPYEGTVVSHNGRKIDSGFYEGEEAYEGFERNQKMFGYTFEHRFNPNWLARQRVRHLDSEVRLDQVYAYGWANDSELIRYYSGGDESLSAWTIDNQLEGRFDSGRMHHQLLAGIDYQYRDNDVSWPSGVFPNIDAFNPVYGSDPVGSIYPNDERHKLRQLGFYLQDQIELDAWRFTLGGRYDRVDIDNRNLTYGTHSQLDDSQFSGRLAALYLFDNGVAPYVSYSTAFTPTSFADADGDLLDPMEGTQIEAGLKYQPPGTADSYRLAAFHITQENVATKEQPTDPYEAIGEIRSQGLEVEIARALSKQLGLKAAYTFTDIVYTRSEDGYEGNRAIYAPRHQASLWLDYRVTADFDAGIGLRHYRDIQADRANTHVLPNYTLVDLALQYELGQLGAGDLYTRLNINNLTDKNYVAACNSLEFCYFGAERSVVATLGYRF